MPGLTEDDQIDELKIRTEGAEAKPAASVDGIISKVRRIASNDYYSADALVQEKRS